RNYDVTKDPMASGRVEQSAPEAVLLPLLRLARLATAGRTAQGLRATAGGRTGAASPNPVISEAEAAAYKRAARPDTWGEAAKDAAGFTAYTLGAPIAQRTYMRYADHRQRGLRRNK